MIQKQRHISQKRYVRNGSNPMRKKQRHISQKRCARNNKTYLKINGSKMMRKKWFKIGA